MTQNLLAYICNDYSTDDVERLRTLIADLAGAFEWSREPPQFVDQYEDDSGTSPEDSPIRTVGVLLVVSDPNETPQTPVAEPTRIVEVLAQFSSRHALDFELQLDGTYVGEIRNGVPDRLLREGLLARWSS